MAKKVIWSAMTGRATLDGQPAAGAVRVRKFVWEWKDEAGSEQTVANAAGEVSLPAIERCSLPGSLVPHPPVIKQVMVIENQGVRYPAWGFHKMDDAINSENDDRAINVTRRLDAPRALHGQVTGICDFQ